MSSTDFDLPRFLGNLHPLLVHLPIGFLLLLAALETLALFPRHRGVTAGSRVILLLTAPAAILTALVGWFLAESGGYDEELLSFHRWTGVAVAALVPALVVLQRRSSPIAYRVGLVVCVALLSAAGHYGGSLTHGRDFLIRDAPEPFRTLLGGPNLPPIRARYPGRRQKTGSAATSTTNAALGTGAATPSTAPIFESVIQPILTDRCVSCHGPDKSKGSLRVDTLEALVAGGDTGPGLVAGNSVGSLVIQRLRLPASHDEHMPPDGKPQLSPDQVTLLAWWIDAGALPGRAARDLGAPDAIQRILDGPSPASAPHPPSP